MDSNPNLSFDENTGNNVFTSQIQTESQINNSFNFKYNSILIT